MNPAMFALRHLALIRMTFVDAARRCRGPSKILYSIWATLAWAAIRRFFVSSGSRICWDIRTCTGPWNTGGISSHWSGADIEIETNSRCRLDLITRVSDFLIASRERSPRNHRMWHENLVKTLLHQKVAISVFRYQREPRQIPIPLT